MKETYRIRYDAGSGGVLISTSQGRIPTDISFDLKKRLVVKKKTKEEVIFSSERRRLEGGDSCYLC